ncbi:MAG: alpha-amylase family glycosyl hydrolase [Sumerlaeia bacterium]
MSFQHRARAVLSALIWCILSFTPANSQVDPQNYPLGATLVPESEGSGAVFRVWAPNATSAVVRGQFNNFSATTNPMQFNQTTGIWSAYVPNAVENQEYKYFLNGSLWRPDPRARNSGNLRDDNSILTDNGASYNWQATDWQIPALDEIVIYELHVGTFSGNGDGVPNYPARYRDVVDAHLDHLQRLSINMVELMPVHEFNGDRSWGYNPLNFYAPESIYGTPNDLRYMIDTLHENDIGVILDVVYNHAATDTNLWEYDGPENIYFYPTGNCSQDTGFGARPDYRRPEVRAFLIDNLIMWMREYRVDGFRLDLTSLMHGYCGEQGEGWTLLAEMTEAIRAENPRAIIIAEELPNLDLITVPIANGGRGFDAQWGDAFHDVLRANLTSGSSPNMGEIANQIAGSGFGRPAMEAVKFSTNHDESGNTPRLLSAIDPLNNFSPRARGLDKIAGALSILSPGIPMLFQGQEFHENKQFDDGEADRIWWGFLAEYGGVVDFYGTLVNLRITRPSLRGTAGINFISINDTNDVLAFQRFDSAGDVTLIVTNMSEINYTTYRIGAPAAGTWYELVNSQSAEAAGNAMINGAVVASTNAADGQPASLEIALPQYSILVFSQQPLTQQENPTNSWVLH